METALKKTVPLVSRSGFRVCLLLSFCFATYLSSHAQESFAAPAPEMLFANPYREVIFQLAERGGYLYFGAGGKLLPHTSQVQKGCTVYRLAKAGGEPKPLFLNDTS